MYNVLLLCGKIFKAVRLRPGGATAHSPGQSRAKRGGTLGYPHARPCRPNGAKAVQGERRAKRKAAGFTFSLPSRRLLYVKAVQGERRAKRKAVQSERKGNKKRKSFNLPFPNCSRFYAKAAGFTFSLPSRRLLYVKAVQGERRTKTKLKFLIFFFRAAACLMKKQCKECSCGFAEKIRECATSRDAFAPLGRKGQVFRLPQGAASLRSALPWAGCCCPFGA